MKKLFIAASILVLSACTMPQSHIGSALIMTNFKDSQIANEGPRGAKVAKSCAVNYLGVFSTGDMSVEGALKKSKTSMTKIMTVEREIENYVVFARVCTVVTGN